ncbi:hypothetical protein [Cupriavidus sp. D39]|uniref:hypothetical protein n=1 Tax=Cupriavidus sp. D39 TaxID=2997877 RepID=UPI00226D9570|nr:hypothetical protein [Cupriavidus sp. D39]MCY0856008.1 hypothetical protein [Cupriavidus sp. D39]
MPSLSTYARVFRQPRLRTDQVQAVVTAAGLFWSVTGEFTTPGLGQAPRFQATDVRLVNADGSETTEMLDDLPPTSSRTWKNRPSSRSRKTAQTRRQRSSSRIASRTCPT